MEAKFPNFMLHFLSEWEQKTFAEGMQESFCHLWCLYWGDPSLSSKTWSEAKESSSFKDNRCKRMVCMGGEVTVYLFSSLKLDNML